MIIDQGRTGQESRVLVTRAVAPSAVAFRRALDIRDGHPAAKLATGRQHARGYHAPPSGFTDDLATVAEANEMRKTSNKLAKNRELYAQTWCVRPIFHRKNYSRN